ncbi:MAG: hypothetical protein J6W15_07130 [Clostridia bacterium]|nr:hypothetical protein [Clostridia bacterium]MBO7216325.1 hypothetical protein [Clostridia bacterium]MBO7245230.1 hypothetical protein [Clostridia bacterium]MBO7737456.1 hypothetical protein [Clostridia bacterium]MBR6506442.1 hypothetical protein [Clostridia bacterium]
MDNNYNATPVKPAVAPSDPSVFVFGLLSLVLSIPIVGFIFAIVARSKAKKLSEQGELTGITKVGKILATIGFIVNLITLIGAVGYAIFYVVYIVFLIGMLGLSEMAIPFMFLF